MDFLSIQNLLTSFVKAYKKRKYKSESYLFWLDVENNLNNILIDLKSKNYKHWNYKKMIIYDNKKRFIHSPILRDHILHHMLYNVLYPVLDKRIPYNSFATRYNKWNHKWLKYLVKKLERIIKKESQLYYLKIDISKYFYSISHDLLKEKIFKYIKNDMVRYAIDMVIDSYKTSNLFDSLFDENSNYRTMKNKWLPIGAIHSQLFANYFMYDLDWYINQTIKPRIYMRYMDDFLLVDKKDNLLVYRNLILEYIFKMKLHVHYKKIQINSLFHWINILWYNIKSRNWQIKVEVNKKNKSKYWKVLYHFEKLDFGCLSYKEQKRVFSLYESRKSIFTHTCKYERYLWIYSMKLKWLLFILNMKKELCKVLSSVN